MNIKLALWKMTQKSVKKSATINIGKISNEEKTKEYKTEVKAQTKIEELNMQDTNEKWHAMVSICLNSAKKILEERPKLNNNRYRNEENVKLSEKTEENER